MSLTRFRLSGAISGDVVIEVLLAEMDTVIGIMIGVR
jgi:hypothetical protein